MLVGDLDRPHGIQFTNLIFGESCFGEDYAGMLAEPRRRSVNSARRLGETRQDSRLRHGAFDGVRDAGNQFARSHLRIIDHLFECVNDGDASIERGELRDPLGGGFLSQLLTIQPMISLWLAPSSIAFE